MNRHFFLPLLLLSAATLSCGQKSPSYNYADQLLPRQMESIDRGLVGCAVSETEAYLSWRLLATDAADVSFDLYKQQEDGSFVQLNKKPLKKGTNFTDTGYDASKAVTYQVVCHGETATEGCTGGNCWTIPANSVGQNYISIPLQTLEGHTPGDCSVGDLDGDGRYEIVVKQEMSPRDNSGSGLTGETKLEAYRLDGTFLWRINLGKNIREGAHYTQFLVYDFDGDGKAEIVCKTADGTVDGLGEVIGDAKADWREQPEASSARRGQAQSPAPRMDRQPGQPGMGRPDAPRMGQRPDRRPSAQNAAEEREAREKMSYWWRRMESYTMSGQEAPQAVRDSFMADFRKYDFAGRMQREREQAPRGGGHILSGPEYLTIFEGATGKALQTIDYVPARYPGKIKPTKEELASVWGDGNGNRSDRYLACVAYLDGRHPSIVMCRGYYTRATLAAFDWDGQALKARWFFDSDDKEHPENRIYRGQGNHNLSVADVDGDGFDEIVYGNMVVDHDGSGLYSTRIGHADAMHVGDLDPERPGLEVFNSQEPVGDYGMNFRNAGTGEIYWNYPTDSAAVALERKRQGPGRAVAFDIDPRYPGSECWVYGGGISGLYNCKGEKISDRTPNSCNFAVWWDADPQRELLDRNTISKYNWEKDTVEVLFQARECVSNNGTKATPALSADLFGDWREEVMLRTRDNRELRIYFTDIPCDKRRVTLMHDPVYRLGIAWQNVAYNIPPHVSYYMQ